MTTAFVARDLISVVDALEDGLLRYWGFSYGTTLGATVTAMFPERIDKVILEGVQNVHEYYHAPANFEDWVDSDKVFSGIFTSCIKAGPKACALAAHGKTAKELEAATWDLLEQAKYEPRVVGKLGSISKVAGEMAVSSYARCQQWKIKPKETYKGGFDVQTKNPVLFIGNTFDGHTARPQCKLRL